MSTLTDAIKYRSRRLARSLLVWARRLPFARIVGRWLRLCLPVRWQLRIHAVMSAAPASDTVLAEVDLDTEFIAPRWPGLPPPATQFRRQLDSALLRHRQDRGIRTPR